MREMREIEGCERNKDWDWSDIGLGGEGEDLEGMPAAMVET